MAGREPDNGGDAKCDDEDGDIEVQELVRGALPCARSQCDQLVLEDLESALRLLIVETDGSRQVRLRGRSLRSCDNAGRSVSAPTMMAPGNQGVGAFLLPISYSCGGSAPSRFRTK